MARKTQQKRLVEQRAALRARRKEFLFDLFCGPGQSKGAGRGHEGLVAQPGAAAPEFALMAYGPDAFEERPLAHVNDLAEFVGKWPVVWLNVDGLGNAEVVRVLGERFGLHRLALEDVLNPPQRPKAESYPGHVFAIARMLTCDGGLKSEQLSLFVGPGFVVTFQEQPGGDVFGPVRDRIRQAKGKFRKAGSDYLAYALLDAVIDAYFPVLEDYAERVEELEARILTRPDKGLMGDLHTLRRDLVALRRSVWPLRDALATLVRDDDTTVFQAETRLFLRDCQDHAVQVIDLIESYRELTAALAEVHLESVNNRMNEVMKVLTIISTIFMPLSFIASVYGMNFDPDTSGWNMPELRWFLGYPFALALMATVAGTLLWLFRRKGWLGGD